MIIRYGEYTIYKGYCFKLNEARQEAPIPFTHYILTWEGNSSCPINEFRKDELGRMIKIVDRQIVDNAFFVYTKAVYQGYEFLVYPYYADMNCVELSTTDERIAKELIFVKLTDSFGKPYYVQSIKLKDIEKLWEEHKLSKYNLPMPNSVNEREDII